jgi:hypothetical protein
MPNYPRTIIVGLHEGLSAFRKFPGQTIKDSFKRSPMEGSCYPDGLGYEVEYHYITDTLGQLYDQFPETPVAIEVDSKTWDPDTRTVDFTFTMRNDGPDLHGEYWYHVLVTEDNIKQFHTVVDSCGTPSHPGQPYWDTTYFNHWVTREVVMDTLGDSLVAPNWFGHTALTRNRRITISHDWVAYNCSVVVFVYEKADSLYKSPVLQAIKESIVGPESIPDKETGNSGIIGIFPNPASEMTNLHFSLSSGSVCSLTIYDMNGQAIRNPINGYVKPGIYNVEIDTQNIPGGTYIVVMETDLGKSTKKIVVL